jgi:hypothetical protein
MQYMYFRCLEHIYGLVFMESSTLLNSDESNHIRIQSTSDRYKYF